MADTSASPLYKVPGKLVLPGQIMGKYIGGALFMTAGQDRRSTGTHYTPVTLTEEIVRYTLEPLVYEGPPGTWGARRLPVRLASFAR